MSVERLYKYGRINEFSEALFTGSSLYFPSAEMLNDPFECSPAFTFQHDKNKIMDSLVRAILRFGPEKSQVTAEAEAAEMYLRGHHREPELWRSIEKNIRQTSQKKIGIYCLTETRTNTLMWTHYADEHKGYCLEFDATDIDSIFIGAEEMQYTDEYPVVDHLNTPNDQMFELTFLTKATKWRYEEEWRLIGAAGPGLYEYPAHALKSVTFGLRMEPEDKEQIRNWVKLRPNSVQFFQAVQLSASYELGVVEC